jgi:hypothetical protein
MHKGVSEAAVKKNRNRVIIIITIIRGRKERMNEKRALPCHVVFVMLS